MVSKILSTFRVSSLVVSSLLWLFGAMTGAAGAGEGELVDATGLQFRNGHPAARIVSLNPDLTENVIALSAGERLVGVSDFCPLPPGQPVPERLGGLRNPGLERIVALSPDLVLATREGNSRETVARLRGLGIAVFVFPESPDFTAYFAFLGRLGALLGREEAAATRVATLGEVIEGVRSRTANRPPVAVFIQIGVQPLVTASRATLIGEMVEIAGGKNIAGDLSSRYPIFSRERVLAEDPEVIIVAAMGSEAEEAMTFWRRFGKLRAVKNRRVFLLDPDTVCRLGPRLAEGLELIELFLTGRAAGGSEAGG